MRTVFLLAALLLGTVPASAQHGDLFDLYRNGDFFRLRDRLAQLPDDATPQARFLHAAVHHAFNDLARSSDLLTPLLETPGLLPDSLYQDALQLELNNHFRLFAYGAAAETGRRFLASTGAATDSLAAQGTERLLPLLEALAEAPPQQVEQRADTEIQMERDFAGLLRVPVRIGAHDRTYVFDTGAGLSVLIRSEAEALGLTILKADAPVMTATGQRASADLAVADRVQLGGLVLRNVVFLVFPDDAFTFPKINYSIPGIVGFPVMEAAGEIHFQQGDRLFIPGDIPKREGGNLALEDLSPRVLTRIDAYAEGADHPAIVADSTVCALDTGANTTDIFSTFYRTYESDVQAIGRADTVTVGGAGGVLPLPVYRLPDVRLTIGSATAHLKGTSVRTGKTMEGDRTSLVCNIGQDVIQQFDELVLNFRSMALLLRDTP